MADLYLPVVVEDLPAHFVFQPDGALRDKVRRSVDMGVTKVIAGPLAAHLVINIARPYYRAVQSWTPASVNHAAEPEA